MTSFKTSLRNTGWATRYLSHMWLSTNGVIHCESYNLQAAVKSPLTGVKRPGGETSINRLNSVTTISLLVRSSHFLVRFTPVFRTRSLHFQFTFYRFAISQFANYQTRCQTSGFSKVGAIIKYNIMHFPMLIKTVLKLVYIIYKTARITLTGKLFHMLTIRLVKQYFRKSNLHLITVTFRLLPLVWCCPWVGRFKQFSFKPVQTLMSKMYQLNGCGHQESSRL